MFVIDNYTQINQRIKHPATIKQLKRDYQKYGEPGKEAIKWISYFDQANIHDPKVYKRLNEFFRYYKMITPEFCHTEDRIQLLRNLNEEKKWIMAKFSDNSIIDETPIFSPSEHDPEFKVINATSPDEILDEIVYWTRFMLTRPEHDYHDLLNFKLNNRCEETARYVYQLALYYKLKAQIIKISAAFSKEPTLYATDTEWHYFVLIAIDDKTYIVDCTYSQFFSWYRNEIELMGNFGYKGCVAGIYMLKDKEREKVARTLLKRGWIELNEETVKHYMDGFTLSYRNGLYYENLGTADYSTPYNIADYHYFIFSNDSQLKREGIKYLGYQMEPLKKSDFKF